MRQYQSLVSKYFYKYMYWAETMQLITLLPFISILDQDIQKLMVYYRR